MASHAHAQAVDLHAIAEIAAIQATHGPALLTILNTFPHAARINLHALGVLLTSVNQT
jgi:hypothetical protein